MTFIVLRRLSLCGPLNGTRSFSLEARTGCVRRLEGLGPDLVGSQLAVAGGKVYLAGRRQRSDDLRRNAHDEVGFLVRPIGVAEKTGQVGDVSQVRHLLHLRDFFVKYQPGDDQSLAILEPRHRLSPPGYKGRNSEPEKLDAVSVVRFGDLGFHQQLDIVAAYDGRDELNRGAEGFEDDGRVQRLGDYDGYLATREEFSFFTGVRQQMRLRENFAEVVRFEKLEKSLPLNVRVSRRQAISHIRRQQERNQLAWTGQDSARRGGPGQRSCRGGALKSAGRAVG